MSNTNAVRGLRGPKYENWPLGDPRAAAPGKYDLKSGENGHLARANGATGGPYCSPALPSVCGRQFCLLLCTVHVRTDPFHSLHKRRFITAAL